jgi:mRNA interferase HigB
MDALVPGRQIFAWRGSSSSPGLTGRRRITILVIAAMHIITWTRCRQFARRHAAADRPLRVWRQIVERSRWSDHHDLLRVLPRTDVIRGPRVVFDIGGNKYRLVADVRYDLGRVYIRGVFTHAEYDRVDVSEL